MDLVAAEGVDLEVVADVEVAAVVVEEASKRPKLSCLLREASQDESARRQLDSSQSSEASWKDLWQHAEYDAIEGRRGVRKLAPAAPVWNKLVAPVISLTLLSFRWLVAVDALVWKGYGDTRAPLYLLNVLNFLTPDPLVAK